MLYRLSYVGKPISDLRLRIADLTSRPGHSAIRSQLVGRAGLEPAKAEPADLQSAPFAARDTDPILYKVLSTDNAELY